MAKISVLRLAEQYLAYVDAARTTRLELAADYLVMAAWLAFLKSRLLLPKEKIDDGGPSGEELALKLAFRLARLDAMREAAAKLMTRQRLGRDVFGRGQGESRRTIKEIRHGAEIYDLLKAYADSRVRTVKHVHVVKARTVWSIKDARQRLERLVGAEAGTWVQLDLCLETYLPAAAVRPTVLASSFGATLEMAREGLVDLQQEAPFAPIFVRTRQDGSERERT